MSFRRHLHVVALGLALLGAASGHAPATAAAAVVPGQIIVGFDGASAADRTQARAAVATQDVDSLGTPKQQLLTVPSAGPAALAALRDADGVDFAEPVYRTTGTATASGFGDQYSLENTGQAGGTAGADIDALRAWKIQPSGSSDVLVGSVDSGVNRSQPGLAGVPFWRNPGETGTDAQGRDKASNGVDDDGDGCTDDVYGCDFVTGDGDPTDEFGHGTATAALAVGPANGTYTGVAPGSSLITARALDADNSGTTAMEAASLDYVASHGARIVNVSIAGPKSTAVSRAITSHPDTLFVVAAGNTGTDVDAGTGTYPCADPAPNVLCVGATDRNDQLASFSDTGSTSVDLAAPGKEIASLGLTGTATWSGTSFAAPLVTGTAALALAAAPATSVAALKQALLGSAVAQPSLAGHTVTGGRLSAYGTLSALTGRTVGARVPSRTHESEGATTATAAPATTAGATTSATSRLKVAGPARRHNAKTVRVTLSAIGAAAVDGRVAITTKSGAPGRFVALRLRAGRSVTVTVPARATRVTRRTSLVVRSSGSTRRYGLVIAAR